MSSSDLTIMILAGGVTGIVIGVATLWFSPRLEKFAPQLWSPTPAKRALEQVLCAAFVLAGVGLVALGVCRVVHLAN